MRISHMQIKKAKRVCSKTTISSSKIFNMTNIYRRQSRIWKLKKVSKKSKTFRAYKLKMLETHTKYNLPTKIITHPPKWWIVLTKKRVLVPSKRTICKIIKTKSFFKNWARMIKIYLMFQTFSAANTFKKNEFDIIIFSIILYSRIILFIVNYIVNYSL